MGARGALRIGGKRGREVLDTRVAGAGEIEGRGVGSIAEAKAALAVGTGGVERALPALTYPMEHHPDSSDSAGIGVQDPAGDVDGLGVYRDGEGGKGGKDGGSYDGHGGQKRPLRPLRLRTTD